MAQAGYTPISLYYSTTASAVPLAANLVPGELAININDGKLYYENSSGVVTLLAQSSAASPVTTFSAGTTGFTPSSATSGAITLAGTLNVANGGTGLTSLTAGYIPFGNGTSAFGNSANLFWDNTNARLGIGTSSPAYKLHAASTGANIIGSEGTTDASFITRLSGTQALYLNSTSTSSSIIELRALPLILATNATEQMRITSAGNVGIGTTTPASQLHVARASSTYIRVSSTDAGSGSGLFTSNATNTYLIGAGAASGGSSLEFRDATNSATRMIIDSSGNVGIGTVGPTAQLQVAGSSSISALKVPNIEEVATISATAATGTIAYDITTQSVLYYTSNASANWTVNFRGSSGTSLNTLMQTGESISVSFLVTQGTTAYYNSSVQVDGTTFGVTTRWQGSAPTSGNASSIDSYTYVIIKTANATFTVLAAQTRFA